MKHGLILTKILLLFLLFLISDWFSLVRTLMIINVPLLACTMFVNILFFVFIILRRCKKNFPRHHRLIQVLFFIVATLFLTAGKDQEVKNYKNPINFSDIIKVDYKAHLKPSHKFLSSI